MATMAARDEIRSYEEFWPYYVAQHLHPVTRVLHFMGSSVALAMVGAAALVSPWWLVATPVAGYSFAWVGHFFFERNQPATFTHPLWSLRGDFRMYRLMLLGRMQPEVERAAALYRK
jgi:hypothetical protein